MFTDLRFALRTLRLNPGFTATAILTIGLGIGVNSAVFSAVNSVLLKSLPYSDPDRLVRFSEFKGRMEYNISYPNFEDWRQRSRSFQEMVIYNPFSSVALRVNGGAEIVPAANTRWNLFKMLGVKPLLGRIFIADDDAGDGANVTLLSYDAWVRYYGRDPNIVGKQKNIGDEPVIIVGVLPESFRVGTSAFWFPMGRVSNPNQLDRGSHPGFRAFGRLKAGATIQQAQSELDSIAQALQKEYPADDKNFTVRIAPMLDAMVADVHNMLWLMFGAVGFVLLIACANVANLLLTRTMNRDREFAVRTALGAGRARILRLMITESLLLSAAGTAIGLLLATWGVDLLRIRPGALPRPVAIDNTVVSYSIFLTLLSTLIFALVPLWRSGKGNLAEALKQGGRGLSGSKGSERARSMLVAAEVALSITLLAGAGLMVRSMYALAHENLGFRSNNLMAIQMRLPYHKDQTAASLATSVYAQVAALRAIPGVETVGAVWPLPERDANWMPFINFEDHPRDPGSEPAVQAAVVTPDYFRAMGIPLLRGRTFTESDLNIATSNVMVVSETLARKFFPNGDALGKRIRMVGVVAVKGWKEIVGIVGDTRHSGLGSAIVPEVYWPYGQIAVPDTAFVAHTRVDAQILFNPVRRAAVQVDSGVLVYQVDTMDNILAKTVSDRRFTQTLLLIFAALALLLACVGIYGVVAVSVVQRGREIGIRIALGAPAGNVFRIVLSKTFLPVGSGLAFGVGAAALLTPYLASQMYGVTPRDPLTFALSAASLGLVALIASLLPARRAMRIDPIVALRQE